MNEQKISGLSSRPSSRKFLPWLLLLFTGSGCAALIYEIVWFQLLQLVIGSSAVSLAVLLGTFMGGMCLGSLALPRAISARRHPLRVYAALELGIGIIGLMVLIAIPRLGQVYTASVGHGVPGLLLRGTVCALCLLPPTVLMGATLPAIARWVETTPQGVSWLGFFYGGNIAGAVFGCLLAGFYLLRVYDLATATFVAASINAIVALIALGLAKLTQYEFGRRLPSRGRPLNEPNARNFEIPNPSSQAHSQIVTALAPGADDQSDVESLADAPDRWTVYVAIALSGLCALGAEVIWTRLLSLMLGGTVYTFSIILAVFLVGLGLGSGVGSFLARGSVSSRIALGWCQMLLAAAIAWTAYMLAKSLPYWPINPSISRSPWFNFQLDLVRCVWAILPATCFWGASFPLALAALASRKTDPGRLVGGVYAANTVGAIFGAVGFSLLLVAAVGTQQAQRLLIGLSTLAAVLLFWPLFGRTPGGTGGCDTRGPGIGIPGAVALAVSVACAAWLAWNVPKVPGGLVAYGRNLPTREGDGVILYLGEGMNSSVAVSELSNGVRNFHVSGKIEASSEPQDMRLQRMLGHIPALLHPRPRSVLIVGCGAGVTAGSFVLHPDITRIVICEIEPLIPNVVAKYFATENYNVVNNPRVEVVYDDARHYVLTTPEKFDIITSDPIHPWVKGAATLYTKEYFELCRRHLNPGGLLTQWVPLYESNLDVVKSEIATFFDAFPNGTIWSNDEDGAGYDIVLLGSAEMKKINVDDLQKRLELANHASVARSLKDVGFKSGVDLLGTYAGQGSDLLPWLKSAQINRDRNLRLQYLAGLGLNSNQGARIYDEMLVYRKFPEEVFVATDESKQALRKALNAPSPNR